MPQSLIMHCVIVKQCLSSTTVLTESFVSCPQSVKDMPILQDAPPPGGFPSIRIERRLPSTGPTGLAIFGALGAIMGYGFYQLGQRRDDQK